MSKITDKIKQRFDYNNIYYVIQVVALLLIINYFKSRYSLMSYASQYVHPGMDDYWMSTGVHETWMSTHSLWQCIKCSFKDAVGLYKRLNGTFLSMFLTGLTPLAFNENRYHFVFDIAIINMAIGLAVIAYSLLHRRWKMSVINCISVCLLFLIFYIDYAPSANEGIYWWPGIANYNLFFGLLLLAQGIFILYWEKHRKIWLILSSIMFFMIGLGNSITGLVSVCLLAYELIYEIYTNKSFKTLFYIPLICGLAGIIIVISAPGNAIRLSEGQVTFFETIIKSFKNGTIMTPACIKPAIRFYLIMVGIISFSDFVIKKNKNENEIKESNTKIIIKTIIFVVLMICLYYASYAPLMYSKSQYFGRVLNTTAFVFYMTSTVSLIYVCKTLAYFINILLEKLIHSKNQLINNICRYMVGVAAIVTIVICTNSVNKVYYYSTSLSFHIEYADKLQMLEMYDEARDKLFMELLDPDIPEVHVGEIVEVSFFPDIKSVIHDMQYYYGKKIIVD